MACGEGQAGRDSNRRGGNTVSLGPNAAEDLLLKIREEGLS